MDMIDVSEDIKNTSSHNSSPVKSAHKSKNRKRKTRKAGLSPVKKRDDDCNENTDLVNSINDNIDYNDEITEQESDTSRVTISEATNHTDSNKDTTGTNDAFTSQTLTTHSNIDQDITEEHSPETEEKFESNLPMSSDFVTMLLEKDQQLDKYKALIDMQNEKIDLLSGRIVSYEEQISELNAAYIGMQRKYEHYEKLVEQQLKKKSQLEKDIDRLNSSAIKYKEQMLELERKRSKDEEKINFLNATLIERETEVSILKLKLTRVQTNLSLTTLNGSKRENEMVKSNQILMNSSRRASNLDNRPSDIPSPLKGSNIANNFDASIWSQVPEDLCPSRRPEVLMQLSQEQFLNRSALGSSTPRRNNKRYQTLPIQKKSPYILTNGEIKESPSTVERIDDQTDSQLKQCQITNLDDSHSTYQSNNTDANDDGCLKAQNNSSVGKEIPYQQNLDSSEPLSLPINISNTISAKPIQLAPKPPLISSDSPNNLKPKGLRKFLDIFKRSGSSISGTAKAKALDMTDQTQTQIISAGLSPFRRGPSQGRSTLVGVSTNFSPMRQVLKTDKPFSEWNNEMIADWLIMIGLSMYANQCRRWIKCGAQMMNATPAEVDRGLGISNPLHRKKLRLAISELNGDCDKVTKAASKLDYLSVARWLDDIGLPQYKDKFIEARIDGRVLNYLTVQDLASMNITSVLHHSSIRCSVKVLRSIDFDLRMLRRRASVEEIAQINSMREQIVDNKTPRSINSDIVEEKNADSHVAYWTCHRVMEWLRLIDFSEYSSNLRGSGLNGALIVYEDGFNSDTMSSILSIPESKTLLRRHLQAFFSALVGKDLATRKNLYQSISTNITLTPSAEIKTQKRSQFSLLKLNSSRVAQETDEYLCPLYPPDVHCMNPPTKPEVHEALTAQGSRSIDV